MSDMKVELQTLKFAFPADDRCVLRIPYLMHVTRIQCEDFPEGPDLTYGLTCHGHDVGLRSDVGVFEFNQSTLPLICDYVRKMSDMYKAGRTASYPEDKSGLTIDAHITIYPYRKIMDARVENPRYTTQEIFTKPYYTILIMGYTYDVLSEPKQWGELRTIQASVYPNGTYSCGDFSLPTKTIRIKCQLLDSSRPGKVYFTLDGNVAHHKLLADITDNSNVVEFPMKWLRKTHPECGSSQYSQHEFTHDIFTKEEVYDQTVDMSRAHDPLIFCENCVLEYVKQDRFWFYRQVEGSDKKYTVFSTTDSRYLVESENENEED